MALFEGVVCNSYGVYAFAELANVYTRFYIGLREHVFASAQCISDGNVIDAQLRVVKLHVYAF
ncbi:MAG: hypothetical protein RLZZ318_580, partial [Bacteroidota bacterium]